MRFALVALLWASTALAQVDGQTTGPLELWVAENGSDGHTCLYNYVPCRSLQGAIDKMPRDIQHPVTIYMGPGRFSGAQLHSFTIGLGKEKQQLGAFLTIQGQFKDAAITGTQTGTVTSTTDGSSGTAVFATLTRSSAGWTANALQGLMLEYTQTNGTVARRIIDSNTSDTLTVITYWTSTSRPAVGSTFRVLDWATIIDEAQPNPRSGPTVTPSNNRTIGMINIQNYEGTSNNTRIYIQRIKFVNQPVTGRQSYAIGGNSDGSNIFLTENFYDWTQLLSTSVGYAILAGMRSLSITNSTFKAEIKATPTNATPYCEFLNIQSGVESLSISNSLFVGCAVGVRTSSKSASYSGNSSYGISDGMFVTEGVDTAASFSGNRCDCLEMVDDSTCTRGTTNISRGRWYYSGGFVMNGCRRPIYIVGDTTITIAGTVTGVNNEYGIVNGWQQTKMTVSSSSLLQTKTGCEILLKDQCLTFAQLQNFKNYMEHNWAQFIEQVGPTTVAVNKPATTVGAAVAPGQYNPAAMIECNAITVGGMAYNASGASRLCICKKDGSNPPVYQWCSLPIETGGSINCAGGTTTVCP